MPNLTRLVGGGRSSPLKSLIFSIRNFQTAEYCPALLLRVNKALCRRTRSTKYYHRYGMEITLHTLMDQVVSPQGAIRENVALFCLINVVVSTVLKEERKVWQVDRKANTVLDTRLIGNWIIHFSLRHPQRRNSLSADPIAFINQPIAHSEFLLSGETNMLPQAITTSDHCRTLASSA